MSLLVVHHCLKSFQLRNATKALHSLGQLLLLESVVFSKNLRRASFRTLHLHRSYPKPSEEAYPGSIQIYNLVSTLYPSVETVILYIFKMIIPPTTHICNILAYNGMYYIVKCVSFSTLNPFFDIATNKA